jgi:Bor protein
MRSRAVWAACALALGGCYKATFIRDPQAIKGVEQDRWVSFWLWGLVNEETFDVHEFCPDGRVAQVQTGGNFGTGIVSALTLGIYAPRKVWVTCAADGAGTRPAARLELIADPEGRLVAAVKREGDVEVHGTVTPAANNAWQVSFEEVHP